MELTCLTTIKCFMSAQASLSLKEHYDLLQTHQLPHLLFYYSTPCDAHETFTWSTVL